MNKKLFFTFATTLLLFTTSIGFANYSNGASKPVGITGVSHPMGLGSTANEASFNRFTDSRLLAALRGRGFYEVDLPGANNCLVSAPSSYGIPANSNVPGVPYPSGVDNTMPAYPFFDLNCMKNHLGTSGSNGGIASHLDERDFLSVRLCPGGNCGSEPVLIGADNGNCTNGLLQRGGQDAQMFTWAKFNAGNNTYWYPGQQPICNKNFTSIPDYEHEVNGLNLGDRVRFFVYIHNSAQEFDAGSVQHQQTAVYNTNVQLDWFNSATFSAMISASNNNGGSVLAADNVTINYAMNGLTLRPVTGSLLRRGSGATGGFMYSNGQTNLNIPMGVVASSYGNVQLAYIDFDVVQAPQPLFNVVKTAFQNGQALTDGDIADPNLPIRYSITVTNNGTGTGNGPVLTDILPTEIVYLGGSTGNVVNSGQTVTLDFSSTTFNAGTTQTFSFNTESNPAVPITGNQFCNEVFLQGVLQDDICLIFGTSDFTVIKSHDIVSTSAVTMVNNTSKNTSKYTEKVSLKKAQNANPNVNPGQTITYTFTVTNTGALAAPGPTFIDPLDPNLDPTTFTTNDPELTYVASSNVVSGDMSGTVIQPGQSVTVSFSIDVLASAPDGVIICNPSNPFDPTNGIDNQVCVQVDIPPLPVFNTVKSAFNVTTGQALSNGDTFNPNDLIRYDITVTNVGLGSGVGPTIIDQLIPELLFVQPVTSYVNFDTNTNEVSLVFGPAGVINPGDAVTLSFEAQLDLNNPNVIAGFVFCNPLDLVTSNISNQICLTVDTPSSFEVIKSAQDAQGQDLINDQSVQAGEVITFSFAVNNTGTLATSGPVFTDQLDTQFDWTTFSSDHSFVTISQTDPSTGIVRFDLSDLNFTPGIPQIFTFSVAVADNATVNTTICNPANPFDPATSIISNQLCFLVTDPSGVIITKEVLYPVGHPNAGQLITPPALLNPGDEMVYRITVTNTGDNTINTVTVLDDLPDDLLHIQNITNNITPTITIPPSLGPVILANMGPIDAMGSTNNFVTAELQVRIVQSPSENPICNQATITQMDEQPPISVIITDPDSACVNIDTNGGGNPDIALEKTIEDENGQNMVPQPGDYFYYRVTATNTGNATGDPFIVSDILPTNILWAPDLIGADPATQYDTANDTVTIQFGSLASNNGTETYRFRVQLAPDAPQTQYCNVITSNNSNITAAEVCFNNTPTSGGGGGPGSNTTVGVCFQYPNSGAWGCEKRYPDWDPDDPDYVLYSECVDQTGNEDLCLNKWVEAKGLPTCTPAGDIDDERYLGWEPDDIAHHQCATIPVISKPCEPNGEIRLSLTKDIMHKDIVTDTNYKFVEANSKLVYGDEDMNEYAYKNICKEKIYYRITATVEPTGLDFRDLDIETAVLRIYDRVIPSQSGWLWGRENEIVSDDPSWTWNSELKAFQKPLTDQEINEIIKGGKTKKFQVNYSVQSDLIPGIDQDESVVKNIAFAILDFTGSYKASPDDPTQQFQSTFIDQKLTDEISAAGQCDVSLDDVASLGADATTKVRIFRPFAQTRGGADYGGETLRQTDETKTNKYTSGAQFADELKQINTFMIDAKQNFYQFLANTATVKNARFGVFNTTPKNDGMYYLDLADENLNYYALPSNFVMNRSETFVIENGDLFIESDFIPKGVEPGQNTSSDYFPAFIVRNGNIIIAPGVKQFDGLFLAEGGQFISGIINSNGNVVQQNSYEQLEISGNIMGDATDLMYRRRYIGEFNSDGVFEEHNGGLQPSIRVTYDTRILDQTPPGLQNFLGGSWQQQLQP